MSNFDLSELALKAICPSNEILYDDLGMPSVMVFVPKLTYAQLGLGSSTATSPAFIVNGQEVDGIYISKYQNIVQNGRAYSLAGVTQTSNVTFDQARQYCEAKGRGWHLMTAFEWGALILWCENNGVIPKGNTALSAMTWVMAPTTFSCKTSTNSTICYRTKRLLRLQRLQ